ncbi:MAG: ABC transporter ATP-binding protein [Oscillospiraceae bacterium]|jgi:putative ABC transport system ATP-binding protein|nr:ABC transporter ATP-binding protein [Oscillospiraceae bacterium]
MSKLIEFRGVSKTYKQGSVVIHAVDNANFSIDAGELVIVLGASGAGKTTILNMLGGMDGVTGGEIIVDGENIAAFNENRLTDYRRESVGFVFQFYNLITNLNALENVEFAAETCKNHLDAKEILGVVGLSERLKNFPAQLSGGEQQRVAIARAVAKNPLLLLCDEPTGALDYATSKAVLRLLTDVNEKYKKTVVIITHNNALAVMADKVIRVKSGKIESVTLNERKTPIEDIEW